MIAAPDTPIPAPALWARTHEEALAALVQLLSTRHMGQQRGIGSEALARALCVSERFLRTLISQARETGTAIGGHPGHGYFICETPEELEETCHFLRGRAMHSLRIEAQLRRQTLADLLGQLRLNT